MTHSRQAKPVSAIVGPLTGYTVAITAARRRKEFGAALERRGANIVYAPAIQLIPVADDSALRQATEECILHNLDFVVVTTGIGFRGWMEAADTWALGEKLHEAIDRAVVLARGPKAQGAIRARGLRERWSPQSESSSEVLEHLINDYDLDGKRIAVQLHGEPLPDMVETLRMAGAEVIEVPVYRWMPAFDTAPLRRLVESLANGASIDCVAFTSAPAAVSFLNAVADSGVGDQVRDNLRGRVLSACVGPVTAGPLLRADIPVLQPRQARLGSLVREIVEAVPSRLGQQLPVAGHMLDVRGQGVVVDDRLVPLTASLMTLMRALISRPGHVASRAELLLAVGDGDDGHAIDVAVGRLRTALGDPRIVQTVTKRGYRLAYEPERAGIDVWRY